MVTIGSVGLLWPRLPTDLHLSPRERWLRKQDRHVPREPFPIMHYDTRHPSILHSFRGSFSMSSQVLHAVPNIRADSSLVRSIHNTFDMTNVFLLFFFFFSPFCFRLPPTTRDQRRREDEDQVRMYPAGLWLWSGWCGRLRWGNPERHIQPN